MPAVLHLGDGVLHLGADGVDHAGQPQEDQVVLQSLGGLVGGHGVVMTLSGGQHPEGLIGHGLVLGEDLPLARLVQRQDLAVLPVVGALLEHLVGGALGVLDEAVRRAVDGGHHLPAGVEGGLAHPGGLRLHGGLAEADLGGPVHQGALGGLAHGVAGLIGVGVGAQGHGPGGLRLVAPVVHHGHLVLGQGAGLVRADDLGAAQGLHGGELADDGVALGHVGHADGQHDGHHRGQALGDGGHSQAHGHHEGADDGVDVEPARPQQAEGEDEHADAQHQDAEDSAELAQLPLQGGLPLLRLGQGVGDLAHLGGHAGLAHHGPAAAVDHGGAHVEHTVAVAQGNLALAGDGGDLLLHRHALAGEGGLLGLQAGALDDAAVGGHGVAGLQDDDVAGDQLVAAEHDHLSVPQHLAGCRRHLLEGLNGLLRLALLVHAQHGVDEHHDQDDEHIREALAGVGGGDAGDRRGHQQNNDHGVAQLLEEALEQGDFLSLGQLVWAILLQPAAGLLACQPGLRALQVLQYPVGGLLVEVHCFITLPFLFVMW